MHIVSLATEFQGERQEIAVNMAYFKKAVFSGNTLIMEFDNFKIYHQCEKVFSLEWLLSNLLNKEVKRVALKTLE
ncbi:hypothetical protein [Helicobacter rodentium]|uniref:hypothetical protein n=1 Tax=Helicobacter rodentium TaxID=59617 RepID=UPI002357B3A1|nr:hypothetical protein [Helicobacter rodentium]